MSELVGRVVDVVDLDVEAGKVMEMARATRAGSSAHPAGAATATHVVAAGHLRDQQGFVRGLGLDLSRVVVGSVRWVYERPLVVGDRLRGERKVASDAAKKGRGGTLRLVTLETSWVDEVGAVVAVQTEVLVERPRS